MLPSAALTRVLTARVASAYIVAMPKKAIIHIQKMAPGPPVSIAPEEPTMLPVPTCAAMAVARAWNELMPLSCLKPLSLKFPKVRRIPSPKQRTCMKRVRMVYHRPTPMSRNTRI